MNATSPALGERLRAIRGRIADAAARSGRSVGAITLIGVAKMVPGDRVRQAIQAGLGDIGENRVQDAEGTIGSLGRVAARWHMIGHLQRNKVARAIDLFDRIHSVDSIELAEALSKRAAAAGRRLPVLVQVNVSGEATKHGVAPAALRDTLAHAAGLPGLAVDGLMAIGTPVERAVLARREFARTRELRDGAERALGIALPELSMGMSGDFEIAVEEGSTMVRVGTALFGSRAT